MPRSIKRKSVFAFPPGEKGAAASEYAVSLAFIIVVIAVAVSQFDLVAVFPALVLKMAALVK